MTGPGDAQEDIRLPSCAFYQGKRASGTLGFPTRQFGQKVILNTLRKKVFEGVFFQGHSEGIFKNLKNPLVPFYLCRAAGGRVWAGAWATWCCDLVRTRLSMGFKGAAAAREGWRRLAGSES